MAGALDLPCRDVRHITFSQDDGVVCELVGELAPDDKHAMACEAPGSFVRT